MNTSPTSATPDTQPTPPATRQLKLRRESLRELTADSLRYIAGGVSRGCKL